MDATRVRVSHHLGANDPDRAKAGAGVAYRGAVAFSVILGGVMLFGRDSLGRVFSDDDDVVATVAEIAPFLTLAFVGLSVFFVSMSVLQGVLLLVLRITVNDTELNGFEKNVVS